MENFGIIHRPTTAYNPKGNGKIERLHRVIKAALRCKFSADWTATLPLILSEYVRPFTTTDFRQLKCHMELR